MGRAAWPAPFVCCGGTLHYQAPPWLASGVYFVKATDHHTLQTRKVVLMK